jgi:EAL domain-containing protein (putative c-di-GMP-specific phosphodiesterase class I)
LDEAMKREMQQVVPALFSAPANRAASQRYEEEMSLPQWSREDLVAALNGNQFVPFYQPKIDLRTGLLIGVEILGRWHHPDLGILSPGQFIELMEQQGLIGRLTECLLLQSLSFAKECAIAGQNIGFAINVSPATLWDMHTPGWMYGMVKEHGLCTGKFTIEVTETMPSDSCAPVIESLTRLRMQGFQISIDDFGTGYSSLKLLSRMPFTELKIDRSFVAGARSKAKSAAILESIMHLAGKLQLRTVAEGIETGDEIDFLRTLGCDAGQGFLLGRPMAQADLIHYLEQSSLLEAA